jgi:hypothetical protein
MGDTLLYKQQMASGSLSFTEQSVKLRISICVPVKQYTVYRHSFRVPRRVVFPFSTSGERNLFP